MIYNNNNNMIKIYIPRPTSYQPPTSMHCLNNAVNERVPYFKMLRYFLGSFLLISFSVLLVLSIVAFRCSVLRFLFLECIYKICKYIR